MKKNRIAVCDTEGEYACNFAEYLNSKKKLPFEVEAFTDVEKLCEYAGKNPPEILLIAEGDMEEQVEKLGTENTILLSEEKQQEEGYKSVYKYQSAEAVIQEVMAYYVENTEPVKYSSVNRKMDIYAIYSPVGGCNKTLFALTATQILGEEKTVLYLNLEDYSGFEALFHLENEENLSDFFYKLRCKEELSPDEILSFVKPMGKANMLVPVASPEDIRDIQFKEWVKLFDLLRAGKLYEALVLDMGNSVDQSFKILSMCNKIYVPVLEDKISRCKMAQFYKIMEQWGGVNLQRIKEISLPAYYPDVSDEDVFQALTWGKWGVYARKVLETDG